VGKRQLLVRRLDFQNPGRAREPFPDEKQERRKPGSFSFVFFVFFVAEFFWIPTELSHEGHKEHQEERMSTEHTEYTEKGI